MSFFDKSIDDIFETHSNIFKFENSKFFIIY